MLSKGNETRNVFKTKQHITPDPEMWTILMLFTGLERLNYPV